MKAKFNFNSEEKHKYINFVGILFNCWKTQLKKLWLWLSRIKSIRIQFQNCAEKAV